MRTKKYNEWLREGFEFKPDSSGDYFYAEHNLTSLKGAPERVDDYFYCDEFTIPKGEWGIEGWLKVLEKGTEKAKSLILTLLSDDLLDKWCLDDPTRLHLLDGHPDLKAGVLKRTGVKDLSRLGRTIKTGLI